MRLSNWLQQWNRERDLSNKNSKRVNAKVINQFLAYKVKSHQIWWMKKIVKIYNSLMKIAINKANKSKWKI